MEDVFSRVARHAAPVSPIGSLVRSISRSGAWPSFECESRNRMRASLTESTPIAARLATREARLDESEALTSRAGGAFLAFLDSSYASHSPPADSSSGMSSCCCKYSMLPTLMSGGISILFWRGVAWEFTLLAWFLEAMRSRRSFLIWRAILGIVAEMQDETVALARSEHTATISSSRMRSSSCSLPALLTSFRTFFTPLRTRTCMCEQRTTHMCKQRAARMCGEGRTHV